MSFASRRVSPGRFHRLLPMAGLLAALFLPNLFWLPQAHAAVPPLDEIGAYPEPDDLGGLHFYLVTVDVGNRLWDNFGHTALRMRDEAGGADIMFNWGGFDTGGGMAGFALGFFLGELNYRLFTVPTAQAYAQYRAEERTVWEDRINLNNAEKANLHRRLMWNLEPENLVYEYDYFDENCTTRLRDYLDEVLDGRLSRRFTGMTGTTYRQVVQSHYESLSAVAMLLDIGMNSNIDRAMSEWEAMFLPLSLRRELLGAHSDVALNGERLPLLAESRVVAQFPPPARQWNAYPVFMLILASLLIWLLLTTRKPRYSRHMDSSHSRQRASLPPAGYQVLGALILICSVFSGLLGCLMLGSWFWSGHEDLHHNLNLLIFWPTDLLGIALSLRLLLLKSPWPLDRYSAPYANYYLLAHLLGIAAHAIIHFAGLSEQNLTNVILWLAAPMALFTILVWLRGFRPAENAIVM
ncbi:MAG: DUF4105 domain-containing protein, partial [Gammaproteobacteria bacterium]|nr:DUF4105 domain-containing protein [Gammaproteobacteria bacterium]